MLQGDLNLSRRGEEQETEQTGYSEIPDFIVHALSSTMEVSLLDCMGQIHAAQASEAACKK